MMLGEEMRERGAAAPTSLGGTPVGLFLYVPDCDASIKRAAKAGAKILQEPQDMF